MHEKERYNYRVELSNSVDGKKLGKYDEIYAGNETIRKNAVRNEQMYAL